MPSLLTNEKIKDSGKVADVFNSFFLSIAENLNLHQVGKEHPISFKRCISLQIPCIKIVPTSEAEIESIILPLKSKNSSRYDEITCKILKACASLISQPISHINKHSLYTGVFLDCLKISKVKPLFKKGDKTSMANYTPLSLLMVFFKVLEKVMYGRLSYHMHTNNILVPEQSGFKQGKSTDNAAFKLTNSVLKSINQKCMVGEYSV
jgi:hypothetical protein